MNKTVSINLGGQVFQVDEQAYERLWKYLEAIKLRYANTKGGDDIISDIESRLAEMFYEAMGTARQVITMADVERIIAVMGQPEEFEVPLEDDENMHIHNTTTKSGAGEKVQRRLFRNPDDKIIGGVASGLSAYFGINDPLWMRLLFLLTFFFGVGSSFLVYIVLLILVPKAQTASEKLQMRGEPINIDNIEKTIREELNDLENRLNNGTGKTDKARGVLTKLLDFVATVFRLFFKILGKVIGVVLVVLSLLFLICITLGISIPSAMEDGIALDMLPHLFETSGHIAAAVIGFGLVIFIPCLFMLYSGIAILLGKRISVKGLGLTSFGLMLVGVVLVIYTIANVSANIDVSRKRVESIVLQAPMDGILRLELKEEERNHDNFKGLGDWGRFREENDTLFVSKADGDEQIILDIKKAPGKDFILEKTITAYGQNADIAHVRTQNVNYMVTQDSASLYFPRYMSYPVADKIRGQQIRLELLVPEGQSVFISPEIRELIYDIKNATNMYDGKMVNHIWKMMPDGLLACLDCGEGNAPISLNGPTAPAAPTPPSIPSLPSSQVSIPLQPFNVVDVDGAVKFYLIPSNESRIVFEDGETQAKLSVEVSGERLTITHHDGFNLFGKDAQVWIYTPTVERVIITGTSNGQIGGFSVPSLHVEVAGASDCRLSVGAGRLTLRLSGASEMEVEGTATELDAEAAGASELNAYKLVSQKVRVNASGASSAEVFAQQELHAESNGASNIDYKGSAKVSSSSSGSSSINDNN